MAAVPVELVFHYGSPHPARFELRDDYRSFYADARPDVLTPINTDHQHHWLVHRGPTPLEATKVLWVLGEDERGAG